LSKFIFKSWEDYCNYLILFLPFCIYFPFEEDLVHYIKKLEFPSSKGVLLQAWLKLACWIWWRFFFYFSVYLLFCYYLPLEKRVDLHLKNLESPLFKDDLCQLCLALKLSVHIKMTKFNYMQFKKISEHFQSHMHIFKVSTITGESESFENIVLKKTCSGKTGNLFEDIRPPENMNSI
jgi:hypothetical protein